MRPVAHATSTQTAHVASSTASSSASSSASSATSTPSLYEAQRDELLAVLETDGAHWALTELERRIKADPAVSGVCHAIAHDLGHAALAAAKGKAAKALDDRDDVCGGGFTHGVIEVALGDSTDPARDLLRVCAPRQDGSCFHGVGHGLMFASGMNVKESLRLCDLAPDDVLSHRCAEGVFMQLFSGDVAGGHMSGRKVVLPAEARSTCESTRSTYQANCWFYSPNTWLAANPEDFSGALVWCADATSALGRSSCARGTGSRTVKYHPDDLTVGEKACKESGDLMPDCVAGMASYWSVHWKGEVPSSDLCERLASARLRTTCKYVT